LIASVGFDKITLTMELMMKKALIVLSILVAGCAANSGVVPIGADSFMITRQAATGFSGTGTLKAEAISEANQYCQGMNKGMKLVHAKEASPPFVFGNFPKAEIAFMCLDRNDPEFTRLTNSDISDISKKEPPMPITVNPAPIIITPPSPPPSVPIIPERRRTHCTSHNMGETTYTDCN
jgi:hypothetical protein